MLAVDAVHDQGGLSHCLQVSLAQGGPGLGAMWGGAEARRMLLAAGFTRVDEHRSPSDNTVHVARR